MHKLLPRDNKITFRCDKFINEMLEEYMEKRDCDKSTAVREVLQYFMELGGVVLITQLKHG